MLKRAGYPNLYLDTKSGIYVVRKMVRGKAIERTTGQTTEKAAIKRLHIIIGELERQAAGLERTPNAMPTLDEWWKRYRQSARKSATTWDREEDIMHLHVLPQFGRHYLNDISKTALQQFLNKRRAAGAAEGTVRREQSLLHAVFEAAVDDYIIDRNPLRGVPQAPYTTRERLLTFEEQEKVTQFLTPTNERWLRFMLGTGLRLNECRHLRPSTDIDWEGRQIHVRHGKGKLGIPQQRWVPLIPSVADELLTILREQIEENSVRRPSHRSSRTDTLWGHQPSQAKNVLNKACKAAEVAPFSPHVLRHTFATRYLLAGGDIYILSRILGHSSVQVTERVYAHLRTPDLAQRSIDVKLSLGRPVPGKVVRGSFGR